jgi:hypothetical protein
LASLFGSGAASPVVAIPARDEAENIAACLAAMEGQTCLPHAVVLLLNNCADATEAIARKMALPFHLDIRSVTLSPEEANAGTARRLAMDHAARLAGADGIILTTDADATVPPEWVALNLRALAAGADAVCGRALLNPRDADGIPAHLHADDVLECMYSDLLDAIASSLCPDDADPLPRHTEASGASIALSVRAFYRAGGIPRVATGEDRALIAALRRVDARIRHDLDIRVTVSGRIVGRAAGGMADTIRRRLIRQDVFIDAGLEPTADAVRRADFRRRVRQVWSRACTDPDLAPDLQISPAAFNACLQEIFFGRVWDEIERLSPMLPRRRVRFKDLPRQIGFARDFLSALQAAQASCDRVYAGT